MAPTRTAATDELKAAPARDAGGQHRLVRCTCARRHSGLRRAALEPKLGRDGERRAVRVGMQKVVGVAGNLLLFGAASQKGGAE